MTKVANRPVDMSEDFRKNGWAYCKYLITDPRSDAYLKGKKPSSLCKKSAKTSGLSIL
jgi:hypothetical protein